MTYLEPGLEQAIADAMGVDPRASDREMARRFEISPTTAGKIRRRVVAGELHPTGAVAERLALLEEQFAGHEHYLVLLSTRVRDMANVIARHAAAESWERRDDA